MENFKSKNRPTEANDVKDVDYTRDNNHSSSIVYDASSPFTGRKYGNYSTDNRRRLSSIPRYRYDYYCFGRGFQFFIDLKQKHYKVLDKNVFSELSQLQPQMKRTVPIGDSLPSYDFNIPVNNYRFQDAIRHMKKEKVGKNEDRLDELIDKYKKQITDANENTYRISQEINQIMEHKLNEFGYQYNKSKVTIADIRSRVDLWLKQIHEANDVRLWALSIDPTIAGVEDNASECLKSILKDDNVLSAMEIIHGDLVHVRFFARNIREKASSISKAIQDEDYDRDASCCPTYLTILRRFF